MNLKKKKRIIKEMKSEGYNVESQVGLLGFDVWYSFPPLRIHFLLKKGLFGDYFFIFIFVSLFLTTLEIISLRNSRNSITSNKWASRGNKRNHNAIVQRKVFNSISLLHVLIIFYFHQTLHQTITSFYRRRFLV